MFAATIVDMSQLDMQMVTENINIDATEPNNACFVKASITSLPFDHVMYIMKKKNNGAVHRNAPIFKNSGCVLNISVRYVKSPKKNAPRPEFVNIFVHGN